MTRGNRVRNARGRSGRLKPRNARRPGLFFFSVQLQAALRKCSRSPNGTGRAITSRFPGSWGAHPRPRAGSFPPPPGFICFLSKSPGPGLSGLRGAQGPGGRAGPSRNGGELSCIAPGRQCPGPRSAPRAGRAPPLAGPRRRARRLSPSPPRARAATPRVPPPRARLRRLLGALQSLGLALSPPRGARSLGSARRPVPGAPTIQGDPSEPPPGRLQLTGTRRAAGHYSIAGCALAPRRRRRRR